MNKRENAKILLNALTDVDDQYVSEANEIPVIQKEEKKIRSFSFMNGMRFAAAAFACAVIAFIAINFVHVNDLINSNNNVQNVNPVIEVETMDEADDITGFSLKYDLLSDDYNHARIIVYDENMIEVSFTNDMSEEAYYIRKSKGTEDISGDYGEYEVTETEMISDIEVNLKGDGELWSVATWENDGYTYALGCQSHPLTLEQLSELIQTIQ